MKRLKTLFCLIVAIASISMALPAIAQSAPTDLTAFYKYTEVTGGYKVALSGAFYTEVDKAVGGVFVDETSGYTWRTGDQVGIAACRERV